jgi:hypothetical protein
VFSGDIDRLTGVESHSFGSRPRDDIHETTTPASYVEDELSGELFRPRSG